MKNWNTCRLQLSKNALKSPAEIKKAWIEVKRKYKVVQNFVCKMTTKVAFQFFWWKLTACLQFVHKAKKKKNRKLNPRLFYENFSFRFVLQPQNLRYKSQESAWHRCGHELL